MEPSLRGLYVPLITPFTDEGGVALDALERLARDVIDSGAAGLVALGTTGEPATLTADERRAVLDTCARVCGERGELLRDGGRGIGQRVGDRGDRAPPGQFEQQAEPADVHH